MIVRRKRPGEPLASRFDIDTWHRIVLDVACDKNLDGIFSRDSDRIAPFMFYKRGEDEPFAFCLIQRISTSAHPSFEFHGGAWRHGMLYNRLKIRASVAILDYILSHGGRVRSRAHPDNRAAIRMLGFLGFRELSGTDSAIRFTLARRRLPKS